MSAPTVYIALQQFGEDDARPRRLLAGAGMIVRENTLGRRLRREDLLPQLLDVDAVLAGVEPYDAELLEALPRLRCISRCGTGTDRIDLEAATRRQIRVFTTPDETVDAVAQMAVAMILALARNLPWHVVDAHADRWRKRTGWLMSEWTIGLVGFGRIGRAVERLLRPFGPRVLVADPAVSGADLPKGVELRPLSALLAEADLVSLHAARRREDGPLLARREIDSMKRGGRLVNTARGFLVDETALIEAVVSGQVAAAALDVFEEEPYTSSLTRLPQVLCTPHVATLTRASRTAMELRCAQQVVDFFARHGRGALSG